MAAPQPINCRRELLDAKFAGDIPLRNFEEFRHRLGTLHPYACDVDRDCASSVRLRFQGVRRLRIVQVPLILVHVAVLSPHQTPDALPPEPIRASA
jgi:hypothetical protein